MSTKFPSAAYLTKAFIRPRIYLFTLTNGFLLKAHTKNVKKIMKEKIELDKQVNGTRYEKIAFHTSQPRLYPTATAPQYKAAQALKCTASGRVFFHPKPDTASIIAALSNDSSHSICHPVTQVRMSQLKYLNGYPAETLLQVQQVIEEGRLGDLLRQRYPHIHEVRTDNALYQYAQAIKSEYLGKTQPLSRVAYDSKIKVIQHALGQHHYISRVQGAKLKTVNEIKIASVFRTAPEAFLKMIVVHELAHFREKEHNKAFYQLCRHMEPNYYQYEFDLRLYLTQLELFGDIYN